jgi:hypothetical protein
VEDLVVCQMLTKISGEHGASDSKVNFCTRLHCITFQKKVLFTFQKTVFFVVTHHCINFKSHEINTQSLALHEDDYHSSEHIHRPVFYLRHFGGWILYSVVLVL